MKIPAKIIVIVLLLGMMTGIASDVCASSGGGQSNTCVSNAQYQFGQALSGLATAGIAELVIGAVFDSINSIMGSISQNFYQGIIGNSSFSTIVNALVIMYIAIYGILIMFNMANPRAGEVITRLAKVGILYSIVSPGGWGFFSQYVGNLFLGGMNELICQFGGSTCGGSGLNSGAVQKLFAPMNKVFAPQFMTGMLSMMTLPQGGFLIAGMLAWGMMDFVFMVIAAIATYVKSMIGLMFLFGISPIFFCCILFEKTRQVFTGWLNEVAAFALLPVLLFAFLNFYAQLIESVLIVMLPLSLDFCWMHWFSMPGIFDISFWRPASSGNMTPGDWTDPGSGNPLPPPISILFGLYFLVLSWLGKNFCHYISSIVGDLTQGLGPGMVSADALKGKFQSAMSGGKSGGGPEQPSPPSKEPPSNQNSSGAKAPTTMPRTKTP